MLVAEEDVLPRQLRDVGLPDIPVASTRCLGRSVSGLPSRSTSTTHSWVGWWYDAPRATVLVQYGTSITFV